MMITGINNNNLKRVKNRNEYVIEILKCEYTNSSNNTFNRKEREKLLRLKPIDELERIYNEVYKGNSCLVGKIATENNTIPSPPPPPPPPPPANLAPQWEMIYKNNGSAQYYKSMITGEISYNKPVMRDRNLVFITQNGSEIKSENRPAPPPSSRRRKNRNSKTRKNSKSRKSRRKNTN